MPGVVIGKKLPDIRMPNRPEQGVGKGVIDPVAIGMPDGADRVVEDDPGQDEGAALAHRRDRFQAMQVIAVTDPNRLRNRFAHTHTVADSIAGFPITGSPILTLKEQKSMTRKQEYDFYYRSLNNPH